MADIRIKDLPVGTPSASKLLPMDLLTTESASIRDIVFTGRPSASQAEAEAGTDSERTMTPLSTKQAINFQVSAAGRSGSYNDLTDKPNVATTDAIDAAVAEAEGYRDDAISVVAAIQPTTRYSFEVGIGATSVTIPGGYAPGTVAEGYLNGLLLSTSSYDGINGSTITFSAITASDIVEGDSTATIEFFIGTGITGFSALNARYLSIQTGRELKGRSLNEFGGGWGSNTKDHTALLQAAADSGENIFIPPVDVANGEKWNVEDPSEWLSDVTVRGAGDNSKIKLMRASGDRACPVFIAKEGGGNIGFFDFQIDGNGADLINPSDTDQFMVVYGSAFIVCAQETHIQNVTVRNGWDCGIVLIATRNGTGTAGYPNDCRIYNTKTFNNGCGYHVLGGPGYIGSGINNGSGARLQVIGCFDKGSRGAVTIDDGGGASGFALGCISMENAGDDSVGTAPTVGGQGSGTAFYSGNPDWSFTECKAYFPWKHGFWLAAPGGMQAHGCEVIGAREHGFYLTGGGHMLTGCRAKNVSQKADDTYCGFFVDTPFGSSLGNIMDSCESVFDAAIPNKPRFGYAEFSYMGNLPGTIISGGRLNGKTSGAGPLIAGGETSISMAMLNNVQTFYSPVVGPGSLPGGAIYRDSNGFIKTV